MADLVKNVSERAPHFFSLGEEIAHSVTHGIGAALSIAGLTVLVVLAVLYGNTAHIVSFSIYGTSLIILYVASTLYHSFQHPRVKHVFKIIDHAAIFCADCRHVHPFLAGRHSRRVGLGLADCYLGHRPGRGEFQDLFHRAF